MVNFFQKAFYFKNVSKEFGFSKWTVGDGVGVGVVVVVDEIKQ